MTIFGIAWLLISIVALFGPTEYSVVLLLISTLFESASVIHTGSISVGTLDIASTIIICQFALKKVRNQRTYRMDVRQRLFAAFALYALVGGIISISIFSGYKVESYDATPLGDWFAVVAVEEIGLSSSFFTSILRLVTYVSAYICLGLECRSWSTRKKIKVFHAGIYISISIVLSVGLIQYLGSIGIINCSWLMENLHTQDLADTSAYWNNYRQLYSVFSEPSHCGPWLIGIGWSLILKGKTSKHEYVLAALCFVEGVITYSSTALITFIVMLLVFAARVVSLRNWKQIALRIIFPLGAMGALAIAAPPIQQLLNSAINKLSSGSGLIRVALIKQSYEAFINTFGLGLGFNQIIGMTFFGSTLAQVGIIGTAILVTFLFFAYKEIPNTSEGNFAKCLLTAILISLLVSSSGLLYAKRLWFVLFLLPLVDLSSADAEIRDESTESEVAAYERINS